MIQISNIGAGLYGERLAVALGYITLTLALATFVSCRSCVSLLGHLGMRNSIEVRWYRAFYKYHGYYWPLFLFTLTLHLMTALVHTEIPTTTDPDALIHWVILSFAFSSLVFLGAVLSSCRSLVSTMSLFMEKGPMTNRVFRNYYGYHSGYWLVFILAVSGHVSSAYIHTGIWPS